MYIAQTHTHTNYWTLFIQVQHGHIYTSSFARFSYCPLIHLRKQSGTCRRPKQSSGRFICEAPPKLCMCRLSALQNKSSTFLKVTFWFSNEVFWFVVKLPHKCKLENCSKGQLLHFKMHTVCTYFGEK